MSDGEETKKSFNWFGTTAPEGIFSHLKQEGFVATLKHNGKGLQFWNGAAKGRVAPVAFRYVGLVGAGAAIADATLRSKNAEGEDRSFVMRGAELLAGVGAAGAALLVGKA